MRTSALLTLFAVPACGPQLGANLELRQLAGCDGVYAPWYLRIELAMQRTLQAIFDTYSNGVIMADIKIVERPAFQWKAAVWAGLIAGAAFMMLEMIMVPLFGGGSPWGPPRLIAAIIMGKGVLPPPATFDIGVLMGAMAVHFPLSIVFALILAWIVARFDTGLAVLIGAGFGLLLYFVNFYGFTAIFPWFAMARNWISIFSHIMFGVMAAAAYKHLAKP